MSMSEMNCKILILFAHPHFERSRVNRVLLQAVQGLPAVTIHDLYELYPDFNVDVPYEKALLQEHDVIVWHHPLYLYGAPALLKQWLDLVLEVGWAHGRGGDHLAGKIALNVVTTGGTRRSYGPGGYNRFPLKDFLLPFAQTAFICRMAYLPPFAVQGTHLLTEEGLSRHAKLYTRLISELARGGFPLSEVEGLLLMNDWLEKAI